MSRRSPRKKTPSSLMGFMLDSEDDSEASEENESSDEDIGRESRGRGRRGRGRGLMGAGDDDESMSSDEEQAHLRWKNVDEVDDAVPRPPPFCPKRPAGVQAPLDVGNPSPGEIFCCFFDSEVFRLLSVNTNKTAVAHKGKGMKFVWTKTSPEEMKKWLGVLLYMSVVKLPKLTDYWRKKTIFRIPFLATVMCRDRFLNILACVHMTDPEDDVQNAQRRGSEYYDLLHHVRPLMEMIRLRCKAFYQPGRNISVDERMVATKARLSFKQYMKAKPTKWGLKFFVLADVNGYTVDFQLYTGKSTVSSGNGLSFDVVMGLVDKAFLGTGYVVYMDNFYTSPKLLRHLKEQGFGACGTYRKDRKGVPTPRENALTKTSPRGSIRWIREGGLLFVKWMDTKEVSICSTVHSVHAGETVLRWQTTGMGEEKKREKLPVTIPTAVIEYNTYMGGVDTSDQMIGTNSVHRKTRRWPITVFQHLLDVATTNSFVIHKVNCGRMGAAPMSRQQFQEALCAYLLDVPLEGRPTPRSPRKNPGKTHMPVPTNPLTANQPKRQKCSEGREYCKNPGCKMKTPWRCEDCNVPLCMQPDRNCYRDYHLSP